MLLAHSSKRAKLLLTLFAALFISGVIVSITSSVPIHTEDTRVRRIVYEQIRMSPNEQRKYCLGIFGINYNISVNIYEKTGKPVFYKVITYADSIVSNSSSIAPKFTIKTDNDYYELVLINRGSYDLEINLDVKVEEPRIEHPYSSAAWIGKGLLLTGGLGFVLILAFILVKANKLVLNSASYSPYWARILSLFTIFSCLFWTLIIAFPPFSSLGLERWYTDHIRHSYTAFIFLKYGFSVFEVPLGRLANIDDSAFKFVTWPEMPHLYPLGSILLFLPFGMLLQSGAAPDYIFKAEIALFVVFGHVCVYLFGRELLRNRFMHKITKIAVFYIFYYIVLLYSLNGMFDSIPVFISILALSDFLRKNYDGSILLGALGFLFKYQVGIFLLPLFVINFLNFCKEERPKNIFRNAKINAAFLFVAVAAFSLVRSLPYIFGLREDLVMNTLYLFLPTRFLPEEYHYVMLSIMFVLSFFCIYYGLKKDLFLSIFVSYLLLPSVTLPYFQQWYFMYIFPPVLLMRSKKSSALFAIWAVALTLLITVGNLKYDPIWLLRRFLQSMGG